MAATPERGRTGEDGTCLLSRTTAKRFADDHRKATDTVELDPLRRDDGGVEFDYPSPS